MGVPVNEIVVSVCALSSMLTKLGNLGSTWKVSDGVLERSIVVWTMMIACFV